MYRHVYAVVNCRFSLDVHNSVRDDLVGIRRFPRRVIDARPGQCLSTQDARTDAGTTYTTPRTRSAGCGGAGECGGETMEDKGIAPLFPHCERGVLLLHQSPETTLKPSLSSGIQSCEN